MKKKANEGRKNIKGDCKNCPDHDICLAEVDKPHYYCTKNETKSSK